jgi:hypothetical protein
VGARELLRAYRAEYACGQKADHCVAAHTETLRSTPRRFSSPLRSGGRGGVSSENCSDAATPPVGDADRATNETPSSWSPESDA